MFDWLSFPSPYGQYHRLCRHDHVKNDIALSPCPWRSTWAAVNRAAHWYVDKIWKPSLFSPKLLLSITGIRSPWYTSSLNACHALWRSSICGFLFVKACHQQNWSQQSFLPCENVTTFCMVTRVIRIGKLVVDEFRATIVQCSFSRCISKA